MAGQVRPFSFSGRIYHALSVPHHNGTAETGETTLIFGLSLFPRPVTAIFAQPPAKSISKSFGFLLKADA
jgi:hypothetical protein